MSVKFTKTSCLWMVDSETSHLGYIGRHPDGCHCFFPIGLGDKFKAEDLKAIADKLDELNEVRE